MSKNNKWFSVCELSKIYPATGVCALVNDKQVALFRPYNDEQIFALNNMDPFGQANVLSRGVICQHGDALWVASPLKKQRFNLTDGSCLENAEIAVPAYQTRVKNGVVEVLA
ncbi:nitrite reductase small subunit NirD [Motilimonas sp. E26]|uniref:nitrite reductase small subunit NirD n=1 Tax=Motilimonas sp. E26 TaxID=2865674 RepID=UPI001E64F8DE|nr:nitrite reductase small subunit NirD [Motilimonas sp. E26]MCE0557275.1 nitrite reductase small subunit NirD [Motilimonas sp. E26]